MFANELPNNRPEDFELLTSQEKEQLVNWIRTNLVPTQTFNPKHTSYGLKHYFENSPGGFYISNGAFKGAMLACGFKVKDTSQLNWIFNVSEKSIKQIRKSLGMI